MGALLSLPLLALPSVGTLWTVAASCCGAATCSAVCSACGKCQSSTATRIAYALMLLVNSIVSWIMLTPWAIKQLEKLTMNYMKISCNGADCYGYTAVHRVNFALGLFHVLLAVILAGVRSSKDGRAAIQNGYWGPKIIAWIGLIVVTFFIPDTFFVVWGTYFALGLAILFLFLGLILLVDLAHTWAEYCLAKIEDTDSSRAWRGLLIGSTLSMYAASIALTIVMYIYFAGSGCSMNQAAITVNLLLLLGTSILSIHPAVQDANPRAGLAQSAAVAIYCTYLALSAVSMEPDDRHCNPLLRPGARGTRTASIVIGALLTMLTIAYTTTRAATQGIALGTAGPGRSAANNPYSQLSDTEASEHSLITTQPHSARREMRAEALRAAIAEGSLPATALDSDSDSDSESDDEGPSRKRRKGRDDERNAVAYNYSLFHIIFLLATAWVATLLTMDTVDSDDFPTVAPVGRTYGASWAKIVSGWVCYGIYSWSLLAPVVLPERFNLG